VPTQGLRTFLPRLGNILFEPSVSVPGPLRRKSRLLSSLLFISLVILGINLGYQDLSLAGARESLTLGAVPLIAAYAMSRLGIFLPALITAICAPAAIVVVIFLIYSGSPDFQPNLILVWLIIPVFLGSFFLSFATSIAIVLAAMTPYFAFLPLIHRRTFYEWLLALVFYVTLSCLILIWSRYRGIVERESLDRLQHHARDLEDTLVQKDALLREVHHRIKNNLQLISSLLYLQARRSPDSRNSLLELQARIRSMSQVYERLQRSDELTRIALADYLEELVTGVVRSYAMSRVSLEKKNLDRSIYLDADAAVSVGLIVTELVTNSFKHAFIQGKGGSLILEFETTGTRLDALVIGDDGPGMSEEATRKLPPGMGMQIVQALAMQLDAVVERVAVPGTVFKIRFDAIPPRIKRPDRREES